MKNSPAYHIPVLLEEAIDGLDLHDEGIYIDATFGSGSHSKAILDRLSKVSLIAFDRDSAAVQNDIDDERFVLINHDFIFMKNFLKYLGWVPVNGILADLGVSSHQLDNAERGFSYRYNAPLDMRMDTSSEVTAEKLLNTYSREKLWEIFREYGEVRNAKKLVAQIVDHRTRAPVSTTSGLANIAAKALPPKTRKSKYLSQIFQALRIAVNNELDALRSLLYQATGLLAINGRLAVITYHSLEDRLVKNYLKKGSFTGKEEKDLYGNVQKPFEEISKKPVTPGPGEISANPRARSAKLRIAKRVHYG